MTTQIFIHPDFTSKLSWFIGATDKSEIITDLADTSVFDTRLLETNYRVTVPVKLIRKVSSFLGESGFLSGFWFTFEEWSDIGRSDVQKNVMAVLRVFPLKRVQADSWSTIPEHGVPGQINEARLWIRNIAASSKFAESKPEPTPMILHSVYDFPGINVVCRAINELLSDGFCYRVNNFIPRYICMSVNVSKCQKVAK